MTAKRTKEQSYANTELKQIFKNLSSKKTVEADDWGSQEITKDDADRYGRVFRKPTQISFGVSPIGEVMEKNYKYVHKKGSAREGYRYKRS